MANHKVIIISGGSRGLGKAFVSHFIKQGWQVATYSRNSTPFIEEMQMNNKNQFYWEAFDGADYKNMESFCKTVFKKFKKIDVVINNAGLGTDGILTLMPPAKISQLITINLESAIQLTRFCTKYMLIKKEGVIINISSINGIRGHSGLSVYGATKAALDGFTRGLAKELGPRGIRVNAVAPGYLDTEMTQHFTEEQRNRIIRRTPLARLGKVEDVIELVHFLVLPQAEFITGQTLVVDGGLTC